MADAQPFYVVLGIPALVGGLISTGIGFYFTHRNNKILKRIDQKSAEALEAIRFQYSQETDQARAKAQALYSRITKLHDKELTLLPELCLKMHTAYSYAFSALLEGEVTVPDFDTLTDSEMEDLLNEMRLSNDGKKKVRDAKTSKDKRTEYFRALRGKRMTDAQEALRLFTNSLYEHRVFLEKDIHSALVKVSQQIRLAMDAYVTGIQFKDEEQVKEGRKACLEIEKLKLIGQVEEAVMKRLKVDEANP